MPQKSARTRAGQRFVKMSATKSPPGAPVPSPQGLGALEKRLQLHNSTTPKNSTAAQILPRGRCHGMGPCKGTRSVTEGDALAAIPPRTKTPSTSSGWRLTMKRSSAYPTRQELHRRLVNTPEVPVPSPQGLEAGRTEKIRQKPQLNHSEKLNRCAVPPSREVSWNGSLPKGPVP